MKVAFKDGHVGIRRVHPNDVPELFHAVRESFAQIRQWMVWCRPDYSLGDALAFVRASDQAWQAGKQYSFVIYDLRDGAILGSVGLSELNRVHHHANLGYWVRSKRTCRGVASTAVRLAARFAFDDLHLNRLELVIGLGNEASIRVAEKAGARREGILRGKLMLNGRPRDALLYALLAADTRPAANVQQPLSRLEDIALTSHALF